MAKRKHNTPQAATAQPNAEEPQQAPQEPAAKAQKTELNGTAAQAFKNKEKVLVLSSRGITFRCAHDRESGTAARRPPCHSLSYTVPMRNQPGRTRRDVTACAAQISPPYVRPHCVDTAL